MVSADYNILAAYYNNYELEEQVPDGLGLAAAAELQYRSWDSLKRCPEFVFRI